MGLARQPGKPSESKPTDDPMSSSSYSILKLRSLVAAMSLAFTFLDASALNTEQGASDQKLSTLVTVTLPVNQARSPASRPGTAAESAAPTSSPAASERQETAGERAKRLQTLRMENCRRRPQTCVQPHSASGAASAPAVAR